MSGIAGLRGTGDWGTDERPKSFREGILYYAPNGNAPIFALMGKAGKKAVTDPEFSWWNEIQGLVRLQVNGALASGDTTVVVDSADPTASTMNANYGTATNLQPGDLLLVEPSADNATFDHELVQVVSILSDTAFTVLRGVGGTTAASISNDAYLLRIGNAFAEGTGAPTAVSRNPVKNFNYTQIFKSTYELTATSNETEARTGPAYSNDKKRKMFDHSQNIEWSMLFGRRYETTGTNGKPLRFMGGLRYYIPSSNVTVFGAAVTANSFLDAIAPMFDYKGTTAGDTRILFMGRKAATELAKVFANSVTYNVNNIQEIYGMKFQRFETHLGTLLMRIHPLMSQHRVGSTYGIYSKAAFGVDFDALKYVYLRNRDTKIKDDVQNKDEDVRRGLIQTECSTMVDYGGLSMCYLGNISAT